jgi:hypothetical protein
MSAITIKGNSVAVENRTPAVAYLRLFAAVRAYSHFDLFNLATGRGCATIHARHE